MGENRLVEVDEKSIGTWSLYPDDLHNLWGTVRELHIVLVGESGAYSSKGGHDLLSINMGGGLLTQILLLLQTTSCYPETEAVNQSYL